MEIINESSELKINFTGPIISVKKLKYSYISDEEVLKNINFEVEEGESIVVLGENGSGKSTLFLCLLNLLHGFHGEITINGITLNKKNAPEIRKRTGLLFQDSNDQLFLPTVEEEIAFGPYNQGLRDDELDARIENTVKELNLEDLYGLKTFHLSHGEKKKVSFGTIYAMIPGIFLLDEPFVSLDSVNKMHLLHNLEKLHDEKKTMIMISHELEFVPDFFSRAIVLHKGSIIYDGSVKDLYNSREILKEANLRIPIISDLFQRLSEEGVFNLNGEIPTNVEESVEILRNLLKK